uniref:Rhodanese-like protein n=1 Tax=Chelativorans sp. (strain BNC1) TaxID=266779 RepID=Q11FX7_CHESB
MKKGYLDYIKEASAVVVPVTPEEAIAIHAASHAVFVDLRDPREIERDGKIPNSFSCPRGMLEFWVDPTSPYHKPVFAERRRFVFYCASGWRSVLAAHTALEMGIEEVTHIEGGFSAWKAAGGRVSIK